MRVTGGPSSCEQARFKPIIIGIGSIRRNRRDGMRSPDGAASRPASARDIGFGAIGFKRGAIRASTNTNRRAAVSNPRNIARAVLRWVMKSTFAVNLMKTSI